MSKKRKKTIAVFLLGGTIICRYDSSSKENTPSKTLDDLLKQVDGLADNFSVLPRAFCSKQGAQLTFEDGLMLARELQEVLSQPFVDGAVVIQGTDTMEEMAYLNSLLIRTEKPVIFTGAMKSDGQRYSDDEGNLFGACLVAACEDSWGRGALVYMNQQIFTAAFAEKVHSNRIDAFRSSFGPEGVVENDIVTYFRPPCPPCVFSVETLPRNIYILPTCVDMEDSLFRAVLSFDTAGVIIEGLGIGNVPYSVAEAVTELLEHKVPVIITSRCREGMTFGGDSYEGGGAAIQKKGAIFTHWLNSRKARIKLSVLLAAGVETDRLSSYF